MFIKSLVLDVMSTLYSLDVHPPPMHTQLQRQSDAVDGTQLAMDGRVVGSRLDSTHTHIMCACAY